jgi:GNAT superfamily N-acetyltransferase
MRIRRMRDADIPAVIRLGGYAEGALMGGGGLQFLTRKTLSGRARREKFCTVVEDKGRIVGMAVGAMDVFNPDIYWLYDVAVEREYRGHGLGKELVKRFEKWARGRGGRIASLWGVDTKFLRKFYRLQGFRASSGAFKIYWKKL